MCARHRTAVLEQVRGRLNAGRPCRLVSTQLVEAGVDIDFPVVYRALGGLDSIAQAAGRCNREGKLSAGRVVVFRAPTAPPRGTPQKGLESTESLLRQHAGTLSLDDPGLFNIYFRSLYGKEDLDSAGIQAQRAELKFETVADSFKVIEEGGITPVVVPYSGVDPLLDLLRREGPSRQVLRGLQPFLVNLYADDADRLLNAGALETLEDLVHVLAGPFHHLYSAEFGLVVDEGLAPEAVSLIA
jgi:CRISPR-associated endonuclease/helicase Cas3